MLDLTQDVVVVVVVVAVVVAAVVPTCHHGQATQTAPALTFSTGRGRQVSAAGTSDGGPAANGNPQQRGHHYDQATLVDSPGHSSSHRPTENRRMVKIFPHVSNSFSFLPTVQVPPARYEPPELEQQMLQARVVLCEGHVEQQIAMGCHAS